MIAYYNNLNEREQWMVIAAVLAVFLYVYYLFIYSPLSTSVAQESVQLVEKTDTLEWMKKVRNQNQTTKKKQTIDNGQLLTLLATQLKDNPTLKFPYQLQQTGAGDIQLTFDEVPFQFFMNWLAKINEQYTITIKQFDAGHTTTPGISKLMVLISATSS